MTDPAQLDRRRVSEILDKLCAEGRGEFLLIGGALVALWLEPRRTTEDIDLVGMSGTSDERYALMDLAVDVGLPVEAINSAADYFVRRIPGWRSELSVLQTGPQARVYRPTPTLFLLLKVARLSEQDLEDCFSLIEVAEADGWEIDIERVCGALERCDGPGHERRKRLLARLEAFGEG